MYFAALFAGQSVRRQMSLETFKKADLPKRKHNLVLLVFHDSNIGHVKS